MLTLIALICLLSGGLMMGKYFSLKKQKQEEQKEKKGFLVLIGAIAFLWFCPGLALFIIGILCLLAILGGVGL